MQATCPRPSCVNGRPLANLVTRHTVAHRNAIPAVIALFDRFWLNVAATDPAAACTRSSERICMRLVQAVATRPAKPAPGVRVRGHAPESSIVAPKPEAGPGVATIPVAT